MSFNACMRGVKHWLEVVVWEFRATYCFFFHYICFSVEVSCVGISQASLGFRTLLALMEQHNSK